jgi:hypothetical protein
MVDLVVAAARQHSAKVVSFAETYPEVRQQPFADFLDPTEDGEPQRGRNDAQG